MSIESNEEPCCDNDEGMPMSGRDHEGTCDNYDGAPIEQWEVTTPNDVYYTDEYYSGTGEMIGDQSYEDYLNRY
jgi:hypothetical protein